jgi:nucleotidyltransferase/DNA polymerase involved in DNA repair
MPVAVTKIWPVRDNLGRVLEYAENHLKTANPAAYKPYELEDLKAVLSYAADGHKTEQEFFVSGVHCLPEIAFEQMTATKERFGKTGGNLAYYAYQSFAPDEVTPQKCHEIGVELAKRILDDRYEVLVTTHLNTHCGRSCQGLFQ